MYVYMSGGIISVCYLYLRHAVTVLLQQSKDQGLLLPVHREETQLKERLCVCVSP